MNRHLTILGGGVAGLAVGHFARKRRWSFTLYEAGSRVGGNCVTLTRGPFRFDSGAHRFHDKDPLITREVQSLLGSELRSVSAPSQIYFRGRFIQFPLTPLNVLHRLGWRMSARAIGDLARSRLGVSANGHDFESTAIRAYGRTIADAFLLGYSEKLWGLPPRQLSPQVSGKRLSGLNVRSMIGEAIRGGKREQAHLDGSFYYPSSGYGAIADALAASCGPVNIRLSARVSRIAHDNERVRSIDVAGHTTEVDEVVSTMPLTVLLHSLDPAPPREILDAARRLRFRNVVLVALFIGRESITPNATVYFPDPALAFTRVYEPRNRSSLMAPPGQTSLVAELPCQHGDRVWSMSDAALIDEVRDSLEGIGWFSRSEVLDACVHRLAFAYPMLEVGFDSIAASLLAFLGRFRNLRLSGRSGLFAYTHLHDLMRVGHDLVDSYDHEPARATPALQR